MQFATPDNVGTPVTVKAVMVVVATVDVPVTPRVPENDGLLVTEIVGLLEVEITIFVPAIVFNKVK